MHYLYAVVLLFWITGCSLIQSSPGAALLGEWKSISSEATIRFENARVSGSDGCNRYGAAYSAGTNNLTISDKMMSTVMACERERMQSADAFRQTLMRVKSYRIDNNRLILLGEADTVVGEFIR